MKWNNEREKKSTHIDGIKEKTREADKIEETEGGRKDESW